MINNVSVLLASYNGEKFIREQIQSILIDLESNDELIISDDGSTDDTLKIISEFDDCRIKIVDGPRNGFVDNFINAFKYSKNEIIFFSDQDDIWLKGKRDAVVNAFADGINLIKHDATIVDENLNIIEESYNLIRGANTSYVKNFFKNTFTGCCMAVRREWLEKIIPIPSNIYHDWWIGLLSCKYKCVKILDDKLILYRRHGKNLSPMKPHSLFYRLKLRLYLLRKLVKLKVGRV